MKHLVRFLTPAALVALAWSSLAQASSPMSVFARVEAVTYSPDKAGATSVKIDGVFAMHTGDSAAGFQYGDLQAGYMYFTCPAGQEALCREQWSDIEGYIGKTVCAGWGQLGAKTSATVRPAAANPQDPDTYDLGLGVQGASHAGGVCPKLLSFTGGPGPGPTDSGAPPVIGSSGGTSGSSGVAPTPTTGTSGSPAPQPTGGTSSSGGACALSATPGSAPISVLTAAGVAAAALLVARRRRK